MNPLSRLAEAVVPGRLGRSFGWLLSAVTVNNIGDGIAMAAGPLLVASQTSDPFLVSLAPLLRTLPQVLLGLPAGVWADRYNRQLQVILGDVVRLAVLGLLALTIVTGTVSIWAVLLAMFALGVAETVADSASRTLLPSVVDRADLGAANQRIQGAFLTTNQFVGPPLGAFLFAAGHALPFATTAACFGLGAVLIAQMAVPRVAAEDRPEGRLWRNVSEGAAWLWRHDALRTLAIIIFAFNVTWGASWSVLVLWARDRVGLGAVGFGLLTTVGAIGGVVATLSYGWLTKRVSADLIMKVCLTLEVLMHLTMALTRSAVVAYVMMLVFGLYAFVWGALGATLRQGAVPQHLQGRVGSVYMLAVMLGMVIGTPLGGALAKWHLTAPNWFAFVGAGLTLAVLWPQLKKVAALDATEPAGDEPAGLHAVD